MMGRAFQATIHCSSVSSLSQGLLEKLNPCVYDEGLGFLGTASVQRQRRRGQKLRIPPPINESRSSLTDPRIDINFFANLL